MNKRIIIAGEGGQGIQTLAKIFSKSAFEAGIECSYLAYFGVEQRGAPSVASLVFSEDKKPRHPKFDIAEFVFVLTFRAVKSIAHYISPNTAVVFDSSAISINDLPRTAIKLLGVPFFQYADENFKVKMANMILLGFMAKEFNLPLALIYKNAISELGDKFNDRAGKDGLKTAIAFGSGVSCEKNEFSSPVYRPKHSELFFKGNNKTGRVLPGLCKGCGICVLKCPVGALKFSSDLGVYSNKVPEIDLEKCIGCGNCLNYCPDGAIVVEKDIA